MKIMWYNLHMKTCTVCGKNKLLKEYLVCDKPSGRRRGDCKTCVAEKTKARQLANPEKTAEIRLAANRKHKYGVTREQVLAMLEACNYTCMICPEPITYMTGHVDHCHSSGKVRGMLCKNCNIGLGSFRDNTSYLESAIEYLKR
jgi:hypothetical protein